MRPTIYNPKGINKVIDELTREVAKECPYITNDYGQAVPIEISVENNRTAWIPAIPTKNDYISMLPDDHKGNVFFGVARDPMEVINQTGNMLFCRQEFSLILWLDQKLYGPYETLKTDEIIMDLAKVIGTLRSGARLRLIETFKKWDMVYYEFNYERIGSQYLMFPYTGFRMVYEARWSEPC